MQSMRIKSNADNIIVIGITLKYKSDDYLFFFFFLLLTSS